MINSISAINIFQSNAMLKKILKKGQKADATQKVKKVSLDENEDKPSSKKR